MQSKTAITRLLNDLREVDFDLIIQARTQGALTPLRCATG